MLSKKIRLAMAFITAFSAQSFASTITVYTDIASFDAATTNDTTVDFTGPVAADAESIYYGYSLSTEGLFFTDNAPD